MENDIKFTGPVQINHGVIGAVQNNAIGGPPPKKEGPSKWIHLLIWALLGSGGVFGVVKWLRPAAHADPVQPAPPPTPAAPAPVTPAPPKAAAQPTSPEPLPVPKAKTRKHHSPEGVENLKDEKQGPTITFNGPAQLNNNSPGAIQNNITVSPPPPHLIDKGIVARNVPTKDGQFETIGEAVLETKSVVRELRAFAGAKTLTDMDLTPENFTGVMMVSSTTKPPLGGFMSVPTPASGKYKFTVKTKTAEVVKIVWDVQ